MTTFLKKFSVYPEALLLKKIYRRPNVAMVGTCGLRWQLQMTTANSYFWKKKWMEKGWVDGWMDGQMDKRKQVTFVYSACCHLCQALC